MTRHCSSKSALVEVGAGSVFRDLFPSNSQSRECRSGQAIRPNGNGSGRTKELHTLN